MSNSDWHQRVRQEAENFSAGTPEVNEGNCKAGDLKGLLHAIVEQISDADRRHSETLSQMQDRLAVMGHDARTMRSRVPENFQPAFERIEAGMSELASRIAEAKMPVCADTDVHVAAEFPPAAYPAEQSTPQAAVYATAPPSTPAAEPSAAEPPKALRSALDQNQQSQSRKRDEEMNSRLCRRRYVRRDRELARQRQRSVGPRFG